MKSEIRDYKVNTLCNSIYILYSIVSVVFIFWMAYSIFLGYDIWFHIKNGEFIILNHQIPHNDPFLFSTKKLSPYYFTNYEWFFGIVAYKIFSHYSYSGIHIFSAIIILSIFIVVFFTSLNIEDDSKFKIPLALSFTLLSFFASYQRFEPRPHIISALFLALFILMLIPDRIKPYKYFLFSILTIIWLNCHIEVFIGIAAIILSILQKTVSLKLQKIDFCMPVYDRLKALLSLIPAFLISPPSKGIFFQGWQFYSRRLSSLNIVEMLPADISILLKPFGLLIIIGLLTFIAIFKIDRKKIADLIFFIPFCALPFINIRHILPSSIVIAPLLASNLNSVLNHLGQIKPEKKRFMRVVSLLIFPLCFIFLIVFFPLSRDDFFSKLPEKSHPDEYNNRSNLPDGAIRFLNRKGIEGNIFCPFHWGNFIIFYENPYSSDITGKRIIRKPFINGMLQTYHPELFEDYFNFHINKESRNKIVKKYDINIVIFPYPGKSDEPLFKVIKDISDDPEWKLAYWDDTSIIYLNCTEFPDIRDYKYVKPAMLHIFGIDDASYTYADSIIKDLIESRKEYPGEAVVKTIVWEGLLLYRQGQLKKSIDKFGDGLKLMPDNALIYYNIAVALFKSGDAENGLRYLNDSLKYDPNLKPAQNLRIKLLRKN